MKRIATVVFVGFVVATTAAFSQSASKPPAAPVKASPATLGTAAAEDPDLPGFMAGAVDKEDYLIRREEHIEKLRGIERGRPFDPHARGRAIDEMKRQERNHGGRSIAPAPSVNAWGMGNLSPFAFGKPAPLGLNTTTWTPIGPNPLPNGQTFSVVQPVSGRVSAIAIHPTNSNIAYVGAAQGGVYRTLDGGATWTPIFDDAETLAIGSIAISPSQPSTIYIGTGEGNFSGDCFFGVGVYRIDNADSATPTVSGPFNKNTNGDDVISGWSIDKVLVHPTNPDIIFIAVASGIGGISGDLRNDTSPGSTRPRGVYRSMNATQANPTFTRMTVATDTTSAFGTNLSATDLEFEPGNPNTLLATIRGFSVAGSGGVYRSTNALAAVPTFTQTLTAGPASGTAARVEIAINKVGTQVTVYAVTSDASGTLKRSTDGGQTWSAALSGATGFCDGQCTYDMPIALDPNNADILYLGGAADGTAPAGILIKSTNALSTASFTKMQNGLHADDHALVLDPSNSSIVWDGNDGGIWKSTDGAATWTSLNNSGFYATQFQSVAVHPIDQNFSIGGTQDNGTECQGPCGTFVGNVWNRSDFGDGGFALIDQSAANLTSVNMYHTYYNQTSTLIGYAYVTSTANAQSTSSTTSWSFNGTGGSSTCTNGGGFSCSEAVEFYAPMALGPGTPNTLYFGTDRLHRWTSPATGHTIVSQAPIVSGVPISAIGISPTNDNVRIVGLENGKVFRTTTGSATLVDVTGTIPPKYVARTVIDPNNADTAYVTLSGYFGDATPHIYKTTNLSNASPTWTGIGTTIPDIPVNAFAVNPSNSNQLFAGTDIGVFRSTDGGATWAPFSNGLPRVAVFDMAVQNSNHVLRIATHGRGMWEISVAQTGTLQGTVTSAATSAPITGATVTAGANSTSTNGSGFYQFPSVAVGTYTVTAAAQGYATGSAGGVSVTNAATTTQNFALAASASSGCLTDTSQADFQAGTATGVDLTTTAGSVLLASSAGTLDQVSDVTCTSCPTFTQTTWRAESFIPSVTGQLTQVDVKLFCTTCTASAALEIRTASVSLPSSTVLATATITGIGSSAFYSAVFTTPPALIAGTTYFITLHTTAAGTYAWHQANGNPYANGAQFSSANSGSTWTADSGSADYGFKTYMSTGFVSAGNLVSTAKDSNLAVGVTPNWTTLSWTASVPASTTVKFQAAGSNSAAGPFNFVGPDTTAATFFTTNGASLSQFSGNRYLKTKAFLSTTNSAVTPTLNDVTVCYTGADCSGATNPTITPTQSPVCGGSTGNTASGPASMSSYAWGITNGAITGGGTSQTVTYTAGTSGSVGLSLTVTDGSGCQTSNSTTVPINPTPATPTASNGGPYCAGATIQLSTPTVAGATYAWTGPNGFTSALQNPTRSNAATADAGTYSVTVTVNGCTSAAGTTSVVVNPIPATPTASNGGPYCAGATIQLSTPTVSGATYAWTGPNGFTSALQNPTRSNATTADAGTYSVTIAVNGCTSAAGTTSVVVNATPATPAASNGGPYCEGATISLSTPTVSGATYAWTGPSGFTSALQNPTRSNATTADAGTYSVTVTVNGCTSAAGTTSVVVNAIPATPTASNGGPYCVGATISLSTPTVSGATYAWTGPNGFTSALQNPTHSNAATADAGTYSVTVTVNGCTSAAGTTSVAVNPIPATPTASNGGPYCAGATIQLSTPTVSGATYAWTGPNGFTSALQNPTRANATTADAGTYSVTIAVNGCTSAAGTTSVVVNPTPATPTAGNGGPYCEGATISLSTPTVSGATYAWTGPSGFTSALQNPTRSSATTAFAGTYSVTVTVNGCTSAAGSTNVVVNAIPATPTASNGGPYCEGATIQLSTAFVSGATYAWSGPSGFTSSLQNPTRASATTAFAGTYSVTVTVNGCTSVAGTTSVVVNPTPATPTATNGGPYCEGATIQLSTPTVAGATYAWTGPSGFISALQNPTRTSATLADAGTYSVTATVNGCTSAAGTTSVVVNPTPATPTATNGGPYCEGATIQLSTPTVSGATYAWTGPSGFTSALQNPTRASATLADTGTYSATVTVDGCTSAAGTTNVVVNAIPATPTASNGGPYCEGATIQLSTAFVSGATYAWSGPNGFTSALQNPTRASATLAFAGTYSVTATVNGCTSAAGTTNVVVNQAPSTPTAMNDGPYCEGATINLFTPTVTGATYAWTGPNGFTSALQNPTRSNATTADAGTYPVTVTVNGCTSAAGTTNVVVNAIPATPTATNDGPYCEGATINLFTPTVAGATYAWTGPNGFTSSQQNPNRASATTADAGTYSVSITVNGCTSAAGTTDVVVTPAPATPTATNDSPYCAGATINLFTPTVAGATYAWTGPNGFTSALQNPTRGNAATADAGTYSVTVTVNGCTSAARLDERRRQCHSGDTHRNERRSVLRRRND
jgi:hypothetical protein